MGVKDIRNGSLMYLLLQVFMGGEVVKRGTWQ